MFTHLLCIFHELQLCVRSAPMPITLSPAISVCYQLLGLFPFLKYHNPFLTFELPYIL
jgi:hypothetical protein